MTSRWTVPAALGRALLGLTVGLTSLGVAAKPLPRYVSVPFNNKAQRLGDNREVVETFKNLQENLKAAGVRLEDTSYQLGRTLTLDAKHERFVGDGAEQANAFLTRSYRKPFVVPETV